MKPKLTTENGKMDKCKIHNVELECLGGRNAHPSNWFCPECDLGCPEDEEPRYKIDQCTKPKLHWFRGRWWCGTDPHAPHASGDTINEAWFWWRLSIATSDCETFNEGNDLKQRLNKLELTGEYHTDCNLLISKINKLEKLMKLDITHDREL